jgi:hypothetical protein
VLPELLHAAGAAPVAKAGQLRTAFLRGLFQLAAHVERLPTDSALWASAEAALAASARDPAQAEGVCNAVCTEIRTAHPTDDEIAALYAGPFGDARGAEGFNRFSAKIARTFADGTERAAIDRLLTRLRDGSLPQVRKDSLRRERFPGIVVDDAKLASTFEAFGAGAVATAAEVLAEAGAPPDEKRARWTLHDSDAVLDWQRAVDDVNSCQSSYSSAEYNRGMLNRFEDRSVRVIALRDEEDTTEARGAMRLAVIDGELSIIVDRLYTDEPDGAASLMANFARSRAQDLGLPLAFGRGYESSGLSAPREVRYADPFSTDYFDLGGGIRGPGALGALRLDLRLERPDGSPDAKGLAHAEAQARERALRAAVDPFDVLRALRA